jgi:hypothetical protein
MAQESMSSDRHTLRSGAIEATIKADGAELVLAQKCRWASNCCGRQGRHGRATRRCCFRSSAG